jgi:hypothetical protein
MNADIWLTETYFDWLRQQAFASQVNRREYEGVLRVLHDIPFYWTIWPDENRGGDALSFRQNDFLGFQNDLEGLDQIWLGQWATAAPSVLEVLLGIARRWELYFEGHIAYYFGHLFRNLELDRYPGRALWPSRSEEVRHRIDIWLSRQFEPNGIGSPFPVNDQRAFDIIDMRKVEIWGQMNAYSAEHFQ